MRRCMELIFAILQSVEGKENCRPMPAPNVEGYTMEQVHYHVRLCEQAGYVVMEHEVSIGRKPGIIELTWDGHEVLKQMRCN